MSPTETAATVDLVKELNQDVTIKNGRITAYRVRLALSFKYDATAN